MEFVIHPLVMLCLKQSSLIYNHLSTYMQAAQIFEPIPAAQEVPKQVPFLSHIRANDAWLQWSNSKFHSQFP